MVVEPETETLLLVPISYITDELIDIVADINGDNTVEVTTIAMLAGAFSAFGV